MPAPAVRSSSPRSCTRTLQPRCASAQAAVRPANPAPAISACRLPNVLLYELVRIQVVHRRLLLDDALGEVEVLQPGDALRVDFAELLLSGIDQLVVIGERL